MLIELNDIVWSMLLIISPNEIILIWTNILFYNISTSCQILTSVINWFILCVAVHHVSRLKLLCIFGYSSGGKERKQWCRLATNMWFSPQILWSSDKSFNSWFHCNDYIHNSSVAFHSYCHRPSPLEKKLSNFLGSEC